MAEVVYLPRASEAVIPHGKLEGYVLNQDHPVGQHKARVFLSALGIDHCNWQYLRDRLLAGPPPRSSTANGTTSWFWSMASTARHSR